MQNDSSINKTILMPTESVNNRHEQQTEKKK